jgi:hypothetical protein
MVGLNLLYGHLPSVAAEEMMEKEVGVEWGESDVQSGEND